MKLVVTCACAAAVLALGTGGPSPGTKAEPRASIKEVMKEAHTSGLFKRVAAGAGDRRDAERLLELYTELARHNPPAGKPEKWREVTDKMVKAAQAAVDGDEQAGKMLKKAVTCGLCHQRHKP
jgi:hypothetical protein